MRPRLAKEVDAEIVANRRAIYDVVMGFALLHELPFKKISPVVFQTSASRRASLARAAKRSAETERLLAEWRREAEERHQKEAARQHADGILRQHNREIAERLTEAARAEIKNDPQLAELDQQMRALVRRGEQK